VTDHCTNCKGHGTLPVVLDEAHDFAIYRCARCEACGGTGSAEVQRRREEELEGELGEVFGTTDNPGQEPEGDRDGSQED
jgi:hypothetical protein